MFQRRPDGFELDQLVKATWRLYLTVLGYKYEVIYRERQGKQPTPEQDEDFLCALIEEARNVWKTIPTTIRRGGRLRELGRELEDTEPGEP